MLQPKNEGSSRGGQRHPDIAFPGESLTLRVDVWRPSQTLPPHSVSHQIALVFLLSRGTRRSFVLLLPLLHTAMPVVALCRPIHFLLLSSCAFLLLSSAAADIQHNSTSCVFSQSHILISYSACEKISISVALVYPILALTLFFLSHYLPK